MQVTRVFIGPSMNVAMSTKAFRNYFNNRRSTHCQLDTRSIRALRFSKPAQLFWNIGVLRLDEPLSAHCLPIKSQNCQERRLQVQHFTLLFQMQNIGFGSTGVCRKENFDILGWKVVAFFHFSSLLPSFFFFILVQFFGARNLLGLISVGNVLGNSRLMVLEGRKCSWLVEDFHHHF